MCGIIGYVGRQEAAPILLEGLERMEYRGYDSTGMAVCGDGVLRVCKKKGRVQVLREMSHDGADLPDQRHEACCVVRQHGLVGNERLPHLNGEGARPLQRDEHAAAVEADPAGQKPPLAGDFAVQDNSPADFRVQKQIQQSG